MRILPVNNYQIQNQNNKKQINFGLVKINGFDNVSEGNDVIRRAFLDTADQVIEAVANARKEMDTLYSGKGMHVIVDGPNRDLQISQEISPWFSVRVKARTGEDCKNLPENLKIVMDYFFSGANKKYSEQNYQKAFTIIPTGQGLYPVG